MKKILFIAILFIGVLGYGQRFQNGHVDVPMTTTEMNAIVSPEEGQTISNSTTNSKWVYLNSVWREAAGGGASQLSDLTDVNTSTPTNRNVLVADGVDFESRALVEADISDFGSYVDLSSLQTITGTKQFNGNISVLGSANLQVGQSLLGGAEISTGNNYTKINGYSYTNPNFARIYFLVDDLAPGTNGVETVLKASENDITYNGTSLLSGGGSLPVDDTTALVQDPVDNTKQVRIDAGGVTTSTTRTITMPDADVDLGALTSSNLDMTTNYTWLGEQRFDSNTKFLNATPTSTTSGYSRFGFDSTGRAYFQKTGTTNDIFIDLSAITTDRVVTVPDSDITLGGTNQTLSLSGTGNKDVTISGTGGNTIDLTGVDGIDPDNIVSKGTGRTSPVQYTDIYGQTQANYTTDGAPSAGELVFITDASPAEVITTATIAMDGWKMYDDQTADAATITLSDCDPGETLTVYINRASAPTLAGTGLTFNQLPNTTAFAAATTMMIIFEVAYDGTTIDYYYVER